MSDSATPQPDPRLLLLIALLQGLELLLLHQALELERWPYPQTQWLYALYSLALAPPTVLLLALQADRNRVVWLGAVSLGAVLFGLGFYVGLQAPPPEYRHSSALLFTYAITATIAAFKVLMYLQQLASGAAFSYRQLFLFSWRNFLTLALALLFALCVWGVLFLWAALFRAIDVDFFERLFRQPWFYYPVLALAHGVAIVLLRRFTQVIDALARVQRTLMRLLLLLLAFVCVIFLCALPFTGLQPLWNSGGSTLVLWMQALLLFFVNAVYSDGDDTRPYPPLLHRFVYAAVALLPVYSLISLYGLWLRVDQYGLTVARCWALLIWLVLTAFALSYLLGIARLRDAWLRVQGRVNVVLGLALLALMLAVNSPLLDFRKLSLASQLARLERGQVTPEAFDYRYLRWQLAGPGHEALQSLRQRYGADNPQIALLIDELYTAPGETVDVDRERLLAILDLDADELPPGLLQKLYEDYRSRAFAMAAVRGLGLQALDLDGDGAQEYLLVVRHQAVDVRYPLPGVFILYYQEQGSWRSAPIDRIDGGMRQSEELWQALSAGDYTLKQQRWRDIELDGITLRVR